ncbi:PREDICTED: 15-hydroxyprostaglandin dehydrogenase [NAD(+)]-like [Nicrophorus vespilloides]|uniref:15-hydroxyprostaglandin dehydrogenase [NAD(+)]-like n=1 Tax=Nicrophorus vespilloides TaxID=110193 RepID=A0ABM1MHE3_NICVS|nr:PREDICTED: 15-hydroxyprostaglandin dehydrogenase [NAD(+)]-like [Nicrophorus vespilloides]
MFDVRETVAIVTGALGGIGRELVKSLLKRNARGVVLLDIVDENEEFLKSLDVEFGGNKTLYLKVDVSDAKSVEDAFKKTIDRFGNLDIVVNNAGVLKQDDIDATVQINLLATIRISNLAFFNYLPKYKSGSEGVIVNIASIAGLVPMESTPVYAATKFGVVSYTQSMGTESHYKNFPVRLMAICPSATDTPIVNNINDYFKNLIDMSKMKMQPPEAVGEALAKVLAEGENGSVWVSKDNLPAIEYKYKTEILPLVEKYVWL